MGEQFGDVVAPYSYCVTLEQLGKGGVGYVDKVEFVLDGPDDGYPVKVGPVVRKKLRSSLSEERIRMVSRANTELASKVKPIPGYASFKGVGMEKAERCYDCLDLEVEQAFYYEFIDTGWNYRNFAKNAKNIPLLTRFLHACAFLRLRLQAWREAYKVGISNVDQKPENNMPTDFVLHRMPLDGGSTSLWLPGRIAMVDMDYLIDRDQADEEGERRYAPVGTPAYMAPEQTVSRYGFRSELFSIGASALEILTGARIFEGTHPPNVIRDVRESSDRFVRHSTSPEVLNVRCGWDNLPVEYREAGVDFLTLVTRLMSRSPDARPSTEKEIRDACKNNPLLIDGPGAIGRRCENVRGVTRAQIIKMPGK